MVRKADNKPSVVFRLTQAPSYGKGLALARTRASPYVG